MRKPKGGSGWKGVPTIALGLIFLFFGYSGFSQTPISLDSTIRYDYLSGDSVASRKVIFKYDPLNRVVDEQVQIRTRSSNQWLNDSRILTSYRDGFIDTLTHLTFVDNAFHPAERTIRTRTDNILITINQSWIDGRWLNDRKLEEVMAHDTLMHQVASSWMGGEWVRQDSLAIINNAEGAITSDTQYLFIPLLHIYIPTAFSDRTYDDAGNLLVHRRYEYSSDSLAFLRRSRDTFGYDQEGFQVFAQFELWVSNLQQWDASLRIIRTKNSQGLLDTSKILFQDFISGVLKPTSRLEHRYFSGTNGPGSDTLLHTVKNIVYQGPFQVPDWIRWYFYSSPTTSATHNSLEVIKGYPNPARDYIQVDNLNGRIISYQLHNVMGQLIKEGSLIGDRIRLPTALSEKYYLLTLFDSHGNPFAPQLIMIF